MGTNATESNEPFSPDDDVPPTWFRCTGPDAHVVRARAYRGDPCPEQISGGPCPGTLLPY